ncbi:SGNH/GDSL hydrolase family protein [Chitinilyticum litopenaei]|uniref:SGNH/GDSL hydrolase family protein n=1 Tax=Chitinilyticum litopenaei TaxID=1121276 RepID=UPI00040A8E68|nr:DUF459 domain-containing protein [Chitinilyticum litopenaei]
MKTDTLKKIALLPLLLSGLCMAAVPQQAQSRKPALDQPAGTPAMPSAAPQRVLAVGDSLMGGVAQMLAWRIKRDGRRELQLLDRHKLSSGLVNRKFYDWPAQLERLLAEHKPATVLIMLGGNDAGMNIRDNGRTLSFGGDAWQDAYRQRVSAMIDLAKSRGARVVWLGLPPMEKADYNAQIQLQNRVYAQAAREAGIPYIDSASLLGDDKGGYVATLSEKGKTVNLRAKDGVHLAPRGGDILARAALAKLPPEQVAAVSP